MVRPPTAANMRLDGGHPALDLVNTVYGQPDGPVEANVLTTPQDLVIFARRVGMADQTTPTSRGALQSGCGCARRWMPSCALSSPAMTRPRAARGGRGRRARRAGSRAACAARPGPGLDMAGQRPAHAGAPSGPRRHPAAHQRGGPGGPALLRGMPLAVSTTRGAGRRWCSMADCGTEAKAPLHPAPPRTPRSQCWTPQAGRITERGSARPPRVPHRGSPSSPSRPAQAHPHRSPCRRFCPSQSGTATFTRRCRGKAAGCSTAGRRPAWRTRRTARNCGRSGCAAAGTQPATRSYVPPSSDGGPAAPMTRSHGGRCGP